MSHRPESRPSIELVGITARLGGKTVLDDVSVSVEAGETLALLGPSGSGKSTLTRIALGLTAPEQGIVRLRGRVVTEGRAVLMPPEERGIAVVFQDLALWPHLTLAGNLRFVLRSRRTRRRVEISAIAMALERVGLAGFERRYPGELSGGEQQRAAIARALVLNPDTIIFDEPLSNLDIQTKHTLLTLVRDLLRASGATALWVTHDPREAAWLGHRIAVLEAGRLVQVGSVSELRAEPRTAFVRAVADELRRSGEPPAWDTSVRSRPAAVSDRS